MAYDTDNFQKDVIEQSRETPVLADFWAEWCGPCRFLGPTLEKLAGEAGDRWKLVKVNTEQHQSVSTQYGIRSIPAVKLFVNGEVVDEFIGALPEPKIREWLQTALPSKHQEALVEAQNLLLSGDIERAQRLLEVVLEAEPENEQAAILMAQSYLADDPSKAMTLAAQIQPGSRYYTQADSILTFVPLFTKAANPDDLPEDPVKQTYLAAIGSLKNLDYAAAIDGFIAVIRRNRRYDDEGPRKATIAIFNLLGDDHEITRKQRPIFSSALFV